MADEHNTRNHQQITFSSSKFLSLTQLFARIDAKREARRNKIIAFVEKTSWLLIGSLCYLRWVYTGAASYVYQSTVYRHLKKHMSELLGKLYTTPKNKI